MIIQVMQVKIICLPTLFDITESVVFFGTDLHVLHPTK